MDRDAAFTVCTCKPCLAVISHYKPSIVISHGLSRLARHKDCKPAVWDSGGLVRGHSRWLKVAPFHRLCMVSCYWPIVTLFIIHTVFEIFEFKIVMILKTGLGVREGHWKHHHAVEPMTSYWRSIVTMALSRVVSEIFQKYRGTLKSWSRVSQGHWKWYHWIDCVWFPICIVYSNFVPKTHHFLTIFDL